MNDYNKEIIYRFSLIEELLQKYIQTDYSADNDSKTIIEIMALVDSPIFCPHSPLQPIKLAAADFSMTCPDCGQRIDWHKEEAD